MVAGLAGLIAATGLLVTDSLLVDPQFDGWGVAVGFSGLTLFAVGLSITLRWQSRSLTSILRVLRNTPAPEAGVIDSADLAEVVRVVDSRIVGFIESIQDENQTSG